MIKDDPDAPTFSMEDLERYSTQFEERNDEEGARTFEVDADDEDQRLDAWIANAARLSRTQVQDLLAEGHIHYLGPRRLPRLKPSLKVSAGDTFRLERPPVELLDVAAENLPLDIVYEDEDLLVINKARGMVVHPAAGINRGTLVNALLYHVRDLSGIAGVARPGIVHRLDKDTSGLMVVAKNDNAHSALTRQFAGRVVKKVYFALVHGNPGASSIIDMPIGRHPMDRKRMAVIYSGRPAVTEFLRTEVFPEYSLLQVRIRTGRTHQIRVHMAWMGHPVAGDPVYCRRDPLGLNGQFLHAGSLEFTHPRTGDMLSLEQPLPTELATPLEQLRAGLTVGDPTASTSPLQILDGWREAASGAL